MDSFTPAVVTRYQVTHPTAPVWQMASVPSSLTNCSLYMPRLLPTCLCCLLVFQLYNVQCLAPALPSFLCEFACMTPGKVSRLIQLAPNKTSFAGHIPTPLMKCARTRFQPSSVIWLSSPSPLVNFLPQCALNW